MSTFLERIRDRARRSNARRNRRKPGAARTTPRLEVLALDESQTEAIRDALDDEIGAGDVDHGAELTDEELEQLTTPAGAALNESASELHETPAAVNEPGLPVNAAPFGNAPGEFDLGAIDGDELPEKVADESIVLERIEFQKSSNLVSAELGPGGVVAVTFKDGKVYRYARFTSSLMAEWKAAKSAGSWFHTNVRTKQDRHPVVAG